MWFDKNLQRMRIDGVICNVLWAAYHAHAGLYIAIIGRVVNIVSNASAFVRYRNDETANRNDMEHIDENVNATDGQDM